MTILRGGVSRVDSRQGGRYYVKNGQRYWSVTTILDSLPKHHVLTNWAKKLTAEYAVGNIDLITMMMAAHTDAQVIDWVKRASDRSRDTAAQLGTLVHEAAEAYVVGRPYPEWSEAQRPFMENAFVPWLEEWKPKFLAIEAPVFHHRYRYAGTLDAIVEVDGVRLVIDYKTTRSGVYPDTALQLTAYRHSEVMLLPNGDDDPTPEVDGAAIVHLRPEGYAFVPARSDLTLMDVFLYIREVFRWEDDTKRGVLGRDVQPDFRWCLRCEHHALLHVSAGCTVAECTCNSMRVTPLKREAAS